MAISSKPNRVSASPASEAQLLAFVEKGGSVAKPSATPAPKGKGAQHPLKFPEGELFERLEHARAAGPVKLPRNTWILQAIAEKLAREAQ
jgi:hypothetical protein